MRRSIFSRLTAAFLFAPSVVLAHAEHAGTSGLVHGFTHPLTGMDHVLVMIAVGMLAAQFGTGAYAFKLRALAVVTLGSLSALFHGYVHGVEMPAAASTLSYTAGFVAGTALLLIIGMSLGVAFRLRQADRRHRMARDLPK